jgi:hypothetical protein
MVLGCFSLAIVFGRWGSVPGGGQIGTGTDFLRVLRFIPSIYE